jgi:hypothetical protein
LLGCLPGRGSVGDVSHVPLVFRRGPLPGGSVDI